MIDALNKKILPTNLPLLTTYPEYGNLFSMLDLEDTRVWGWIATNFLHFHYYKYENFCIYKNHFYFLSRCPFLHCFIFPREYILTHYNFIEDLLTYFIDNNYYIILNLDRYYLRNTHDYKKKHLSHQTFVYGYDKNNKTLHIADNLENGKYVQKEYYLEDVSQSFKEPYNTGYRDDTEVKFIKRIKCELYSFDLDFLIKELKLFINSEMLNEEEVYRFEPVDYYNIEAIKYQANLLKKEGKVDIRAFHLFYEHKCLMEKRIQYLFNEGYLQDDQNLLNQNSNIKKQYNIIVKKIAKTQIEYSSSLYENIGEQILKVCADELIFIQKLIDELENKRNK